MIVKYLKSYSENGLSENLMFEKDDYKRGIVCYKI